MGKKYAIGVDYGTQSGRAVLVDLVNGAEIAEHVTPYRHHVIDEELPLSGIKLEHDWALQHPLDYLEVLESSVPAVIRESGVSRFAESINSAQSLDAGHLARLPGLRKNFSLGLGETYKYTVPEVAAVLHRLNGRRDEAMRAAAIAERNKSGRLSSERLEGLRRYVSEMD